MPLSRLVGLGSLDIDKSGPILSIEHVTPPESCDFGDPQARIRHHGRQGDVQPATCESCLLRFERATPGNPWIEGRRADRGEGISIQRSRLLLADTQLPRQSPQRFRDAGGLWGLQAHSPVSIDYCRDRKSDRGHALPVISKLRGICCQNLGSCRQIRKILLFAPGPEFPNLAGVVPASVFRLGILKGVRHSPALFIGEDGRCIFRLWLLSLFSINVTVNCSA